MEVYVTGIDMSAAFDTIHRHQLINILDSCTNEDVVRMVRVLLSDTSLEVKITNTDTEPFTSNIGSPQGDGVIGHFSPFS